MADRFTTRVAVFVIVRNEKGEMLLQQRGPGKYLAGYWDFPSGHNELGESLQTTSIRELKEEVDLDGRPEDLKLVHIDQYFIEVEYINFVFSLNAWSGTPRIGEPNSCSSIAWFAPNTLPGNCVNVVRAVESAGFSDELTYSVTDKDTYYRLMELPKQDTFL